MSRLVTVIVVISLAVLVHAELIPLLNSKYNFWTDVVDLELQDGYAYITSKPGMLSIYDLNDLNDLDPDNPLSTLNIRYACSIKAIKDTILWLASDRDVKAVNISDPADPVILTSLHINVEIVGVSLYDNLLVARSQYWNEINYHDGFWDYWVKVFDVSDIYNPIVLNDSRDALHGSDYSLLGSYLYYFDRGLNIMDLSDPANPIKVAETGLGSIPIGFSNDETILVASSINDQRESFIQLLDITNPLEPSVVTELVSYRRVNDLHIEGDTLSIVYENNKIVRLDVSTPESPEVIAQIAIDEAAVRLSIYNDKLGLRHADGTVSFSHLGNVNTLDKYALLDSRGYISAVGVDGSSAYVVAGHKGLRILDISNPLNPIEIGHLNEDVSGQFVSVSNGYVYIADYLTGTKIVNATDTENPYILTEIIVNGLIGQIKAQNGLLYIQVSDATYIYNVSTPSIPTLTATIPDSKYFQVIDDFLLTSNQNSISCYDIGSRSRPKHLWISNLFVLQRHSSDPGVNSFYLNDGMIYVIYDWAWFVKPWTGMVGSDFYVFDISDPVNPQQISTQKLHEEHIGSHQSSILNFTASELFIKVSGEIRIYTARDPVNLAYYYRLDGFHGQSTLGFNDNIAVVPNVNSVQFFDCAAALSGSSTVKTNFPARFDLAPPYPNPFNSTTTINYSLSLPTKVSLELYNTLGQQVLTLYQGQRKAGRYDAVLTADELVSGLYFVKLSSDFQPSTQKVMLLK